ncbi:hypothetical protein [Nitrosomonas sp.]|uniref:hypothetical protein n=1 Tax=Nitrosomonas sp. TaxID=42353 RepID=UPI002603DF18|nr:hypothetical protein [Nitrosomonas sp.]
MTHFEAVIDGAHKKYLHESEKAANKIFEDKPPRRATRPNAAQTIPVARPRGIAS